MSLKWFHLVFIALSTFLTGGFSLWAFDLYHNYDGGSGYLAMSVTSVAIFIALVLYGVKFIKNWKTFGTAALVAIGTWEHAALACSSCFGLGDPESERAVFWSVFTLFCFIMVILAVILTLMFVLRRRIQRLEGEGKIL